MKSLPLKFNLERAYPTIEPNTMTDRVIVVETSKLLKNARRMGILAKTME
jgi:hypothetical protein